MFKGPVAALLLLFVLAQSAWSATDYGSLARQWASYRVHRNAWGASPHLPLREHAESIENELLDATMGFSALLKLHTLDHKTQYVQEKAQDEWRRSMRCESYLTATEIPGDASMEVFLQEVSVKFLKSVAGPSQGTDDRYRSAGLEVQLSVLNRGLPPLSLHRDLITRLRSAEDKRAVEQVFIEAMDRTTELIDSFLYYGNLIEQNIDH